ncbi:MAG: UDP-N-acetylmuramate--L-alanine ligase [Actinomycetaceae bacterium]|nr:UDP-N-acetylmuramate--L-alanine ligase [Arcanobacterium sp.]MDD7505424.1 UDP-N-acetylmuramate--L-alanine ligase [Actinomycetaceae bacterium]
MKFHLIGVGGAGMSVVAELLLAEGHSVSGSDREASAVTAHLVQAGAHVTIGHTADAVPADATIVASSAIKADNPELAIARERSQNIIHRSQALRFAAGEKDFVAVAGSHGKTTTSAMIATALDTLGREPSWAIGGSLQDGRSGGHLGAGSVLVAEADESDASFLNYAPRIAVVTNIEADHLDHYGSEEAFFDAFAQFARRVVPGGMLIVCADDDKALKLAQQAHGEGIRVGTFGRSDGRELLTGGGEYVVIHDVPARPGFLSSADIEYRGGTYSLDLLMPGRHILLDAAGAWLVGVELGEDPAAMSVALRSFKGAARRFDLRGDVNGVRVVDDYAHHPTEVSATLTTAREVTSGKVRVIFQPHLYSRTQNFAREFAHALSLADDVIVTSVYAAREVPEDGVEGDAITAELSSALYVPDMHEGARILAERSDPGDIIITMGAGSVTQLGGEIVDGLINRFGARHDA